MRMYRERREDERAGERDFERNGRYGYNEQRYLGHDDASRDYQRGFDEARRQHERREEEREAEEAAQRRADMDARQRRYDAQREEQRQQEEQEQFHDEHTQLGQAEPIPEACEGDSTRPAEGPEGG